MISLVINTYDEKKVFLSQKIIQIVLGFDKQKYFII
jgi:hypothetical protein